MKMQCKVSTNYNKVIFSSGTHSVSWLQVCLCVALLCPPVSLLSNFCWQNRSVLSIEDCLPLIVLLLPCNTIISSGPCRKSLYYIREIILNLICIIVTLVEINYYHHFYLSRSETLPEINCHFNERTFWQIQRSSQVLSGNNKAGMVSSFEKKVFVRELFIFCIP